MKTDPNTVSELFFSRFPKLRFKRSQIVLHPGDFVSSAFYIKKGYIREYAISPKGTELTIHTFSPGSFFPMTSLLADIYNRYYFDAITEVEAHTIPKEKLLVFLNKNPEVLLNLTSRILIGIDKLSARIEHLTYASASQRLISILIYLASHFGVKTKDKIMIDAHLTHRDIGSLTGLSRETVSREWKKLENKHIVSSSKRSIIIENEELLRKELTY